MYSLRRKGAPGRVMELSPVLKEIKSLKKTPMLNGIKGVVISEQDPTQLSFPTCEKELNESLNSEGNCLN